eukprot:6466355-Amphidinium_carterae.1
MSGLFLQAQATTLRVRVTSLFVGTLDSAWRAKHSKLNLVFTRSMTPYSTTEECEQTHQT